MMRKLYPKIEPFESEMIDVGCGHHIYTERCGNKNGVPVVYLHGGPGGGCKTEHRRFFDPKIYQVILFDQRGSGRSLPFGSTDNNSSQLLVADMETIRKRYQIKNWVIFGGSWGSTLGLLYTQSFPERVCGLVLRASFLAREKDLNWFLGDGVNKVLPVQWDDFVNAIGGTHNEDLVSYIYSRLCDNDDKVVRQTALAWEKWSGAVVSFSFDSMFDTLSSSTESSISKARIELHYAINKYFLEPNQLLRNAYKIPNITVMLIHGGRDMTCLPSASWDLHKAIPGSQLEILRTTGHLSGEEKMTDALVRASDEISKRLQ